MNIIVSVSVITYNQEQYIAQTLDNIIAQKTTFPIEIVVGDDCSTDKTRTICIEYKEKYPDLIRLRLPEKNMGSMSNWIANIEACQGKYIAFCEGDDYWTDPHKLQKQVDFLDSHPDFSLCANVSDVLNNGIFEKGKLPKQTELTTTDVILQDWGIMTASIVYRKEAFEIPDWYGTIVNGDYGLQLLTSLKGKLKILPDAMSVYRRHEGGISHKLQPVNQAAWMTYLLYHFDQYTNRKFHKAITNKVKRLYKNQLSFAKDYNMRRAIVKLSFYNFLRPFAPFLIRNLRK
ncbi:glycosyltransferase [Dysgonomonas sp. 25]|uniref:glycosyltransferase family 2 protein n=1 Tax=Dysgonomonas sp. 25 TaxID=2302933 RepID=UPI0013D062DE|nr:glycosyltransferase [Dysgonomonas sp. 25]